MAGPAIIGAPFTARPASPDLTSANRVLMGRIAIYLELRVARSVIQTG
jgi:hypothetical protein